MLPSTTALAMDRTEVVATSVAPVESEQQDEEQKATTSTTTTTLLQRRLHEIHGIPVSETMTVRDSDGYDCEYHNKYDMLFYNDNDECEEKKEDDNKTNTSFDQTKTVVVVDIKTLVWEVVVAAVVVVGTETERQTSTFYVVAALQMKDKVDLRKLKSLVLERLQQQTNTNSNSIDNDCNSNRVWSIQSMQLAPRTVAESLTGYKSGCMPPICHDSNINSSNNNMELYLDRSIADTYYYQNEVAAAAKPLLLASIGSGILGQSLVMDLGKFLRVAGVGTSIYHNVDYDSNNGTNSGNRNTGTENVNVKSNSSNGFCTVGLFLANTTGPEFRKSTVNDDDKVVDNNTSTVTATTSTATSIQNSNETRMMSGSEIRKLKQEERKDQREAKKDRLKEYRSFNDDDDGMGIVNKAKLFRTTARKKGRIKEMELLIREALDRGEFKKLMEIPDEQGPRTNIDKNALHICAWRGDIETVVRLVELSNRHCPELDVVNLVSKGPGNYGKTPIFYALTQCRDDVVRYLVSKDGGAADLLVVNNKGQTPCSIAHSHVNEETQQMLYRIEAEQLRQRRRELVLAASKSSSGCTNTSTSSLFVNYRAGVHSDCKLYGDLDPRFPIDDDNRYYVSDAAVADEGGNDNDDVNNNGSDKGRWARKNNNGYDPKIFVGKDYMNRTDDLTDQIKEYEASVRLAPEESVIEGIPTVFSPRSLRPTVRWWNRDDKSLAAANNNSDNNSSDAAGQVTFTQSRSRGSTTTKPGRSKETDERQNRKGNVKVSKFSERRREDIESLELVSIQDCIGSGVCNSSSNADDNNVDDSNYNGSVLLVDNAESLSRFEAEIDECLFELKEDMESRNALADADVEQGSRTFGHDETILLKYAWGLDCEWKPGPECGLDSPVSTLQLGTRKKAFLIDLQTICGNSKRLDNDDVDKNSMQTDLDRILLKLFRNPNTPLVGFGVVQDLSKLAASFPHLKSCSEFAAVMDLQSISSVIYNTKRDRRILSSLQKMTAALLNKRLDKSQQVSDWSQRPLSTEQVSYAMLDAAIIPLLLTNIVEDSEVAERYNGQFFNAHKNLLSTVRYTPVQPCEEGFMYEVSFGSIKSTLGKAFARQSWPTKMKLEEPEPPKLVPCRRIQISDDGSFSTITTPTVTKKERAHLRKIGGMANGRTRPKPIPLKSLVGNLENVPIPGIFLGYTKESCAFRVVGHELFKTIPEGTYIGFNRRAGVVETSNAWILFCNFGGEKAFSEFSDNGRQLSFRVSSTAQSGRSSESCLYREMVSYSQLKSTTTIHQQDTTNEKKILLFARESTRTKYMYCGFCSCTDVIPLDSDKATLVLTLEDYDELMNPDLRISSDFELLVRGCQSDGGVRAI